MIPMNTEMQPIQSLAARSVAKFFAMWYCFWGLVGGIGFVYLDAGRLDVPLGLYVPFVHWNLNYGVNRSPTLSGVVVQAIFFVLFCTGTGWISGLLTALAYNLLSKHFGFQLRGSIEADPLPDR
jgi:D-alanyl-lipoteichoic acid acyltransferase DltB (MBOAT superfamily)